MIVSESRERDGFDKNKPREWGLMVVDGYLVASGGPQLSESDKNLVPVVEHAAYSKAIEALVEIAVHKNEDHQMIARLVLDTLGVKLN